MDERTKSLPERSLALLRNSAVITPIVGAVVTALGYVFLAGHLVTEPHTTTTHWPLPFAAGVYVIALVALYVVTVLGGVFLIAGIPLAQVPVDRPDNQLEQWRVVLLAVLCSGTIIFLGVFWMAAQVFHRPLPPQYLLAVPLAAIASSLTVAARSHGLPILKRLLFPTLMCAFQWLVAVTYIILIASSVARQHHWKWQTSAVAWEYLVVFLIVAAAVSTMVAHRRWGAAYAGSAFAVLWACILDPADVFGLPFRFLGW